MLFEVGSSILLWFRWEVPVAIYSETSHLIGYIVGFQPIVYVPFKSKQPLELGHRR